MKLPEYITADEVKRVCKEIGLRDWSKITDPTVSEKEASTEETYLTCACIRIRSYLAVCEAQRCMK